MTMRLPALMGIKLSAVGATLASKPLAYARTRPVAEYDRIFHLNLTLGDNQLVPPTIYLGVSDCFSLLARGG